MEVEEEKVDRQLGREEMYKTMYTGNDLHAIGHHKQVERGVRGSH